MHSTLRIRAWRRGLFCIAIVGGLLGSAQERAHAALFTLIDSNSSASFDTSTPANLYSWIVDGSNRIAQQAFWYRVGNVPEQSVHLLPIGVQGTTDGNFDGNPDSLFVRYNGAGFSIETRYILDGGLPGSGASDMTEQISINNLLDSPLDFHFFQYVDFDLANPTDSTVFTNANTVLQSGGPLTLTETVVTPVPSHREAALFNVTLVKLNDGVPTTLSDTPIGVVVGPGDMTWAYQWDVVIQPFQTFQISKDKNFVVPEPSAGVLMSLLAGSLLRPAHRKRRNELDRASRAS